MTTPPTVVGINRTQDGSIAVAQGSTHVWSLQKERVTRTKHHWGRLGDLPDLYVPRLPQLREPIDLVVECYSSDRERAKLEAYRGELLEHLRFRDQPRIVEVSHHVSHLYSAFPPSPFDRAAAMIIDAQGSPVRLLTPPDRAAAGADRDLLEVATFYRCERGNGFEVLAKQLWDGDWSAPVGLGCFYYLLTRMIFPQGEGSEGKVMGLAPFGRPGSMGMPDLVVRDHEVLIPDEWIKLFGEKERFVWGADASFEEMANLAAEGQHAFETALLQVAAWVKDKTGEDDVVFAGGTALNCSANGRILREGPFGGVFIPPSPHDGGTALGCALYGMIECLDQPVAWRWVNDFLGPDPDPAAVDAAVRGLGDDLIVERPEDLVEAIVELLDGGRVVGLHNGRSESGPRALGNRSILADPRRPAMQDFINAKVKGREWFRPLAPLVLAEEAERIFEVDRPAPFMQYAALVRAEHREALPAITHVDGTARLQTVEPENTPFLHAVLDGFARRTGCPVLLNTSLNGKGDPVVETPQEALDVLTTTSMHAMAMPPYLVRKREEPEVPPRG